MTTGLIRRYLRVGDWVLDRWTAVGPFERMTSRAELGVGEEVFGPLLNRAREGYGPNDYQRFHWMGR